MTQAIRVLGVFALAAAFGPAAFAHAGAHLPGAGFVDGLAHPFLGADHVALMLCVGLWAAGLGRRAALALGTAGLLQALLHATALGQAAAPVPLAAGFVTATLLLQLAGFGLGRLALRADLRSVCRGAAAFVVAGGLASVIG